MDYDLYLRAFELGERIKRVKRNLIAIDNAIDWFNKFKEVNTENDQSGEFVFVGNVIYVSAKNVGEVLSNIRYLEQGIFDELNEQFSKL